MGKAAGRILVVDDDGVTHRLLNGILKNEGYQIDSAYDGEEALQCLENEYDLVITDVHMRGLGGIELLQKIRKRGITVEVIMLTGDPNMEFVSEALDYGVSGFVSKPIEQTLKFKKMVKNVMALSGLARENREAYSALVSGNMDLLQGMGNFKLIPKEILRRLLHIMPDGIVVLDSDQNIIFANPNFAEFVALEYKSLMGRRFHHFIGGGKKQKISEVLNKLASGQKVPSLQIELQRRKASDLPVVVSCAPVFQEREYLGAMLVISDISEITDVRKENQILANLVENIQTDMIFLVQPSGTILMGNLLARKTFALEKERLEFTNISDLFISDQNFRWDTISDVVNREFKWRGEITSMGYPNKEFPAEMTVNKVPGEQEVASDMICFIRDITREKEIEIMKSEFISLVSHELRTPLASVKNAVNIVGSGQAGEINDDQKKFLELGNRNIDRLTAIIDENHPDLGPTDA
ncbi:MAG: response regulator, partial [Nitrospinota bacterium]